MKRYIDAELLRKEIESLKSLEYPCDNSEQNFGFEYALDRVSDIITSLQQEQSSEKTCKNCGFYENNCPYIRGKFIPYPSKVCKDYTYSVIKEQEQPSEDLEKEVKRFLQEEHDRDTTVRDVARHFANWGVEHAKKGGMRNG